MRSRIYSFGVVYVVLFFSLFISCSQDSDDNEIDIGPKVEWNNEYSFIFEYYKGSLIGGELQKNFLVSGESGEIEIEVTRKDHNEEVKDIHKEVFFVEAGKEYRVKVRCLYQFSFSKCGYVLLRSPQGLGGFRLEIEECVLNGVEILGIEEFN